MTTQIITTFSDAWEKIQRILISLEPHGIKVKSNTSLGSLFAKVRQLNELHEANPSQYDSKRFFASMDALRIAEALEMTIDAPGSLKAIRRIVGSDMDLSARQHSQGKDALWELDVFRYLRLAGAEPRFEEPDLVVPLDNENGDYGVACKKLNLESGVAGALECGCSQLKRAGLPGIVAVNLDEMMEEKALLRAPNPSELHREVEKRAREFISRHNAALQRAITQGGCDAVWLSVAVVSEMPDGAPPIRLARIPFVYANVPVLSERAKARLATFRGYLDKLAAQQ